MTTSQIMYDLTGNNLHRLDANARKPFAIGGYINGAVTEYIWTQEQWHSFPESYHVRINVTGEVGLGNCLDVENGDADPGAIPGWIESQLHQNDPLLVYCNRSNLDACVAERAKVDHWHNKVYLWVATLDGTLITDRAMTQFAQLHDAAGAYADVSVILNTGLINQMAARIGHQ